MFISEDYPRVRILLPKNNFCTWPLPGSINWWSLCRVWQKIFSMSSSWGLAPTPYLLILVTSLGYTAQTSSTSDIQYIFDHMERFKWINCLSNCIWSSVLLLIKLTHNVWYYGCVSDIRVGCVEEKLLWVLYKFIKIILFFENITEARLRS